MHFLGKPAEGQQHGACDRKCIKSEEANFIASPAQEPSLAPYYLTQVQTRASLCLYLASAC